jgi:glycerol uptake facilitator-like aquaporin
MFIVLFIHIGRRFAPSSKCVINSMIVLICAIIPAAQKKNYDGLKYCMLWIIGDLLGTLLAIAFYEKVFVPNVKHLRALKREQQN